MGLEHGMTPHVIRAHVQLWLQGLRQRVIRLAGNRIPGSRLRSGPLFRRALCFIRRGVVLVPFFLGCRCGDRAGMCVVVVDDFCDQSVNELEVKIDSDRGSGHTQKRSTLQPAGDH